MLDHLFDSALWRLHGLADVPSDNPSFLYTQGDSPSEYPLKKRSANKSSNKLAYTTSDMTMDSGRINWLSDEVSDGHQPE
jgi:hypothetical protein